MERASGSALAFCRIGIIFFLSGVVLIGRDRLPSEPNDKQAAAASSSLAALKVHEELIGELSPGSKVEIARSTDDHLAWVEKKGGKQTVKLDGRQVGGVYDDVNFLRFSADQQHLAFAAKRDSKWVLVLDGQECSKPYGRLTAPTLSANGRFVAVSACNGKKCRLVVNGDEMESEFEDISAPVFTSNGEHYGYFGKRDKKWALQLDGKQHGPEMDDYATWRLGLNGERVAVAALIDKNWTWVVDGKPGPGFDVISDIAFSPDWKHHAYGGTNAKTSVAKNKTSGAMVEDGRVLGEYEGRGFGGGLLGAFAGVSSNIATAVRSLAPDFHGVSDPQYTSEGKLVYAARRGEDDVVVFSGGAPGPPFEDIVSPIGISDDGKHIGYVVKRGESFVEVRDHKPGASFPGKRAESFVGILIISPDGEHLAYEIVRGGGQFKAGQTSRALRRVVVNGQGGPEYDALGVRDLALTLDGKSCHYVVVGAEGSRDRAIFNGLESKLYDNVFLGSVDFIDNQTIEFVAQDGMRFIKVTAVSAIESLRSSL